MAGLLGEIFSAGNVAKRKLRDLLGNPVEGMQQILGNVNDRARNINEMTAAAAQEKDLYGPATQRLGGLLAEAYNPMGITVYHGSPAKFNRFDATKIGSGEGAQAFGYGHYVAESPATAEQYKEMLKSKAFSKIVQNGRNDYSVVSKDGTVIADNVLLGQAHKAKDAFDAKVGSVYEIDLPDDQIAKMLNWDKPLSQQPQEVKEALSKLGIAVDEKKVAEYSDALLAALEGSGSASLPKQPLDMTGEQIIREIKRNPSRYFSQMQGREQTKAMINPDVGASELLRQSGIPGIRYFDQVSRGTGEGTSNFVVFPGNEDLLTILKRNGGLLD